LYSAELREISKLLGSAAASRLRPKDPAATVSASVTVALGKERLFRFAQVVAAQSGAAVSARAPGRTNLKLIG